MKAHPLSVRLLLAAATAVLGFCALPSASGAAILTATATADTPLPPGWELCILQGVGAPATQANVADLDEWQLAEGGSTNNTAAYNPFNTGRTTNVANTPLPLAMSPNGFPAFSDWISGCAATVATILQTNMAPVAAALLAGNVSPPPAFLAVVDQSQWCAPSADGTPCYADMIGGATGNLAQAVLSASSALDVYGNVRDDLHSYQNAVTSDALAQLAVATTTKQLSAAEADLTSSRNRAADAQANLRKFAVDEYVNSGLYQASSLVSGANTGPSGTQSQDGVVANQYATVVASDLLAENKAAEAAVKVALAQRDGVQKTLQQDETTLTNEDADEIHSLVRLVADVETLQKAGACTTAVITTSTPGAATGAPLWTAGTAGTGGSGGSGGSAPSSASGPSSPTTTSSTTTTTVAPTTTTTSSTTTTTTPGGVSAVKPAGTTSTTVPASTTTIVAPTTTTPSSTTTTTVPSGPGSGSSGSSGGSGTGAGTAPAPTPNPGGLQVLQGCVTALAPAASA